MKTKLLVLVLVAGLALALSPALGLDFGWTVSDSQTNPLSNTGVPVAGVVYLYLWYYCTNTTEGLAAAEFDMCSDIGTMPIAFVPYNPWLNAGTVTQLLIAVGGCPLGPLPVGYFLFVDGTGGGIQTYPCPSAATGSNVSVNCIELGVYDNDYIGYASNGSPAPTNCEYQLCRGIAVESASWGNVKILYR